MNRNDDIDNDLFEALGNASIDANGIDWNAFEKRRQKKKRRALLWFLFAGLLLLTGIVSGIFVFNGRPVSHNRPVSQNEQIMGPVKQGPREKLTENHVTKSDTKTNAGKTKKSQASRRVYRKSNSLYFLDDIEKPTVPVLTNASRDVYPDISVDMTEMYILPYGLKKHIHVFDTAQNSGKRVKILKVNTLKRSAFFVQIQAGPALNFPGFRVSEAGKAFLHKDYAGVRKGSESGLAGYGFQLTCGLSLKKLDVSFGLGLSNTKVSGNYDFVYFEKPIINPDGTVAGYNNTTPTPVRYISKQNYTFVEVPLYLDYTLYTKNKIKTSLHMGMVNQFLKNISGELPNALFMDHKDQLSTENFRTYSANMEIGCRLAYRSGKRIQYAITPVYRKNFGFYQVQSYYRNSFNSFGIQFSIRTSL